MIAFLRTAGHAAARTAGNALLVGVFVLVAVCGIGLTALYLIDHVEETPGMRKLRCFVAPGGTACPPRVRDDALARLRAELEAVMAERARIDAELEAARAQLAGLRAIEEAVDRINLFQNHRDPSSGLGIVVGTVSGSFTELRPEPDSHYCYIRLPDGPAGEERQVSIRSGGGDVDMTTTMRESAGISEATLAFARSVCRPYRIGDAS